MVRGYVGRGRSSVGDVGPHVALRPLAGESTPCRAGPIPRWGGSRRRKGIAKTCVGPGLIDGTKIEVAAPFRNYG